MAIAKEQLIFAVDMVRHGDRTPLHQLETVPYSWPQGLGELTARGVEQHIHLGKKLRQHYIEKEKLLPHRYHSKSVYVRSTDYDRAIMSAQALLWGLYSGTDTLASSYQPVPIHTQPLEQDILIRNDNNKETFECALRKHVYSTEAWQEKTKATQPKWAHWQKLTGWKIENLRDLVKLGDMLAIYHRYAIPLPAGLTETDIHELEALSKWGMAAMYQPKAMGDLFGKETLMLIHNYIMAASKKQTSLKYVLLSAHDSSLLSLMSAMKTPLTSAPPYASHLSFALKEQEDGTHRIVITFNETIIKLPNCSNVGCTLKEFNQLLTERYL